VIHDQLSVINYLPIPAAKTVRADYGEARFDYLRKMQAFPALSGFVFRRMSLLLNYIIYNKMKLLTRGKAVIGSLSASLLPKSTLLT